MKRKFFPIVLAAICAVSAAMIAGCGSGSGTSDTGRHDNSPVRVGTMPNEHFLPMWAAEKDGVFGEVGIDAELLSFDSAQALSAAIAAGEVDMAMVDIPRAVKLCESGTPVDLEWITLGTEDSPGTFGVMAAADAPYSNLQELAAYMAEHDDQWATAGVGVAANTVPEYVYEKLCEKAGVNPADIPVQEVASLPERYSLMASGKLSAAALTGSLLRLGEVSGMKVLAEEGAGDNISQSVMIAREKFAADNMEAVMKIAEAWDMAAAAINAHPDSYGPLLAEKANLNEAIAGNYPVPTYPMALASSGDGDGARLAHPSELLVKAQLEWMESKGYISRSITYDETTGAFAVE